MMNALKIIVAGILLTLCADPNCVVAQENAAVKDIPNFEIRSLPGFETPDVNAPRSKPRANTVQQETSKFPVTTIKKSVVPPKTESLEHAFESAYESMKPGGSSVKAIPSVRVFPIDSGKAEALLVSGQAADQNAISTAPEIELVQEADTSSSEFLPRFSANSENLSLDEMTPLQPSSSPGPIVPLPPSAMAGPQEPSPALWWKQLVTQPLGATNVTQETNPNMLVYESLRNSPRIQAISKDPLIRELQVAEAQSDFDPVNFVRGQWDDRNDPVGNTLTTGGAPFLQDHIITAVAGVRQKMAAGGDLEIGQTIGFQNSNSRFFVPQDQGTATIALNFTQPLMRGRGKYFNQSQILIAQSAGGVAWEAFKAELQQELEFVVRSYWQLYYQRSLFLQKKRNVTRGEAILSLLEGRRELDSLPSQITRAQSAVLSRKTELVSAFNDVRDAETEVRRLIADPNWLQNQTIELVPVEPAVQTEFDLPLKQVVETALEYRPEIKESLQRAKIAAIQYDVSTNELLPELSLLLGTYLSALDGDSGIERAFQSQFAGTTPGYSVGFEFEFPLYNRAARSRLAQRGVQRSKIRHEVNEVMQNIIAEAQIAQRRVSTAFKTMDAAIVAIQAAQADLAQNRQRWESFALVEGDIADGQTPTTVLDQLLDSQDRLTNAEFVYSQAELELKMSEVGLRRVMGTLLMHEDVVFGRTMEDCAPSLSIGQGQMNVDQSGQAFPIETEMLPIDDTDLMSPAQLQQMQQEPFSVQESPNR